MDNVRSLVPEPDPDVVAAVEEILADVKAGTVRGFMFVALYPSETIRLGVVGDVDDRDLSLGITDMTAILVARREQRTVNLA